MKHRKKKKKKKKRRSKRKKRREDESQKKGRGGKFKREGMQQVVNIKIRVEVNSC